MPGCWCWLFLLSTLACERDNGNPQILVLLKWILLFLFVWIMLICNFWKVSTWLPVRFCHMSFGFHLQLTFYKTFVKTVVMVIFQSCKVTIINHCAVLQHLTSLYPQGSVCQTGLKFLNRQGSGMTVMAQCVCTRVEHAIVQPKQEHVKSPEGRRESRSRGMLERYGTLCRLHR